MTDSRPVDSRIGVSPDDPAFHHIAAKLGYLKVFLGFDDTDPMVRERAAALGRKEYEHEQAVKNYGTLHPPRQHVVYYLRVGRLIKVGTTGNLTDRLRSYPPDAVLLATEPGDRKVELRRHRQFAADLDARAEWFRPSAELLAHINSLREQPLTPAELAA